MATLSQTPANVRVNQDRTQPENFLIGEAISAGMPVYLDTSVDPAKVMKALAGGTVEQATVLGVAVTDGDADNDYVAVQRIGNIKPGATMTVGSDYYLGTTAGILVDHGDLVTDDWVVSILRADTTTSSDLAAFATPTIQIA